MPPQTSNGSTRATADGYERCLIRIAGQAPSGQEAIVLAAIDLIAARGARALRIDDVAREAGVGSATVKNHFPTTHALAAEVIECIVDELTAPELGAGSGLSPVPEHLAGLAHLITDRPALLLVLAELELRGRRDPLLRASIRAGEERWLRSLSERLDNETALPEQTAALVVAATNGAQFRAASASTILRRLASLIEFEARAGGRRRAPER